MVPFLCYAMLKLAGLSASTHVSFLFPVQATANNVVELGPAKLFKAQNQAKRVAVVKRMFEKKRMKPKLRRPH